jgi:hypothetical protein
MFIFPDLLYNCTSASLPLFFTSVSDGYRISRADAEDGLLRILKAEDKDLRILRAEECESKTQGRTADIDRRIDSVSF